MLYLKTCSRCHGDMYLDKDLYGRFKQCFQCGFVLDLVEEAPAVLQVQSPRRRGKPVAA